MQLSPLEDLKNDVIPYAYYRHDEGDRSGFFHTYDGLQLDPAIDQPRKVHIFLPRDYETSDRPYPVIYMNDGQTAFWPEGLSAYSWDVRQTLADLYQLARISPVIIVAVHPLNRAHEYLHVKEYSTPLRKEGGGLPIYSDYMVRLKKFVDDHYRTLRDRRWTTVVGSSHGGLAAFYTGATHGHYFGNLAALSPSFWVGGVFNLRDTPLMSAVHHYLLPTNQDRPRIWIDWGLKRFGGFHNSLIEQQAAKWGKEMVRLLEMDYMYRKNKDLFVYKDKIGGHDERSWAYRFRLVLQTFYGLT
ncbi:alpha/beta hydrolase [Candidatus Synechococcus calcipolaris G9]|uniref:Alpha/beta hydrolase n=1 Tax=Candidatus Synechococcus calcipolaris G9 TaxID=1497997 RepID=A0ABT6EY33_9SYNE|nr:alpha/beta hydrolase-fold protein [Candidatus Synechococcus calcipolaris]MDG2990715.1 alpha/beta hydrolase [Candidatus Synechococcus calcipolaris G9]